MPGQARKKPTSGAVQSAEKRPKSAIYTKNPAQPPKPEKKTKIMSVLTKDNNADKSKATSGVPPTEDYSWDMTSFSRHRDEKLAAKRQKGAIILFIFAIGSILLVFINAGKGWGFLRSALFGFFGVTSFLVPVAFILISIGVLSGEYKGSISKMLFRFFAASVIVCSIVYIFGASSVTNIFEAISRCFNEQNYTGSGIFGVLFGGFLVYLLDIVGASAAIILITVAYILLVSRITLVDALRRSYSYAKTIKDYAPVKNKGSTVKPNKYEYIQVEPPGKESDPHTYRPENFTPRTSASVPKPYRGNGRFDVDVDLGYGDSYEDIYSNEDPIVSSRAKKKAAEPVARSEDELKDFDFQTLDEIIQKAAVSTKTFGLARGTAASKTEPPPKESEFYRAPNTSLLEPPRLADNANVTNELKTNAEKLVSTLKSFGVETQIVDISRGPSVTRYELQPSAGVKISRITNLSDDIAMNLATSGVRIEAPIPNKAAVGIEVPNKNISVVSMREIVESEPFNSAKSKLTVALGKDIAGDVTIADLARMPHLLIAGATGSGKSVCINSLIISLLYKSNPDEVKFLMVDPKVVELGVYNGIPHLLVPVVTDPRKASGALAWAVSEMLNRYKLFAEKNVRDLTAFNNLCKKSKDLTPLPQIVIVIDELADLMMVAPNEVEDSICRLAQMARAAGMHLVIATQRPSVDVITGIIKANIPSRIAFAVSSQVDSRTILDMSGAEKLLGRGDMLFYPVGSSKPIRVQGCLVSDREIEGVINYIKHTEAAAESEYDAEIMQEIERQAAPEKKKPSSSADSEEYGDEMLPQAIECVVEAGIASTTLLQRRLRLGYARAARIIDEMEQKGIVGPFEGSKPRQVLMTKQQWLESQVLRN